MTKHEDVERDLIERGFTLVYDKEYGPYVNEDAEPLFRLYPRLMQRHNRGVWCTAPGMALIRAFRDARHADYEPREIAARIASRFSDAAVVALTTALGTEGTACQLLITVTDHNDQEGADEEAVSEELPNHDVLAAHGYVIAYDKTRSRHTTGAELLHAAYPVLFVAADEGVWCHAPGNMLILAVRRAFNRLGMNSPIKAVKEVSTQRELVTAIRFEFNETAVRALVESLGKDAAATTVAERALERVEMMRNGKRPRGGTEP